MAIDYDYFLSIAETLNISRAAKKNYVSQQRLSAYLQRLENDLGVTLFNRKPKLSLTPAGKIFYDYARQIDHQTRLLYEQLIPYRSGQQLSITVGMTLGRGLSVLPSILMDFYRKFPTGIFIGTRWTPTNEVYELLLNNTVDLALGIDAVPYPGIKQISLYEEDMFLAISERSLKHFFPNMYPACKEVFDAGINLSMFSHVPFLSNTQTSLSERAINRHLKNQQISLNVVATIDSSKIHLSLVREGYFACIFTEALLVNIYELNQNADDDYKLQVYPLQNFRDGLRVSLLLRENQNLDSEPFRYMVELFQKHLYRQKKSEQELL